MFCQNCGKEIHDDAVFCEHCGTAVVGAVEEATEAIEDAVAAVPESVEVAAHEQPRAQTGEPQVAYAQPTDPQASYAAPATPGQPAALQYQNGSNPGTAPMVMGILSIVLALFVPIAGAIAGIVLGALGISKGGKVLKTDPVNGRAKGGKITGIIGLILSIFMLLATIVAAVVLGVAVNEAIENPDDFITQMEQIASDDPESQQQLEELKQELEAINGGTTEGTETESGSTAGSTETAPTTNEPQDYSGGEAFDTWAAECTNSANQPTLYALTELKGWQLETLLQQLGYEWDGSAAWWYRASDSSWYAMVTGSNALTDLEIAEGDKGGIGTHAAHILNVGKFGSAREALSQTSQIVLEDVMFTDDDESALAVVYGPSMQEYLLMVGPDTENKEGYYAFYLFSEEAVGDGVFTTLFGQDVGNTINDVWQNVTGGAVGDYISNR